MESGDGMLDAKIDSFTSMRIQYLRNASREGGARIPTAWASNQSFEELERKGLVTEGNDVSMPGWQRQWLITPKGRVFLASTPQ